MLNKVEKVEPELVFVVKGYDLDKSMVKELGKRAEVVVNWNPDNPYMARYGSEERRAKTYLEAIPAYDVIFTWGRFQVTKLRQEGAKNVKYLPFAYDPRYHRPEKPRDEYRSQVIFLGHWSEKRERHVSALTEFDLKVFGDKWRDKVKGDPELKQSIEGGPITGVEYSRAMSSAHVTLNVLAEHAKSAQNMRTWEVPATGSLLITNRTQEQQHFFPEDEASAMYDSPEELTKTVDYYLSNSEDRERVAANGLKRVENHTYEQRICEVISVVEDHL